MPETAKFGILSIIRRHQGVIFAVGAASFYTGNNLLMKVMIQASDPVQLVVQMSLGMILCPLLILVFKGIPPPDKVEQYFWLSLSGVSTCAFLVLYSFAVVYTDVGDALTVTYSSLIIAGIISCVMLKEAPQKLDILFSIIAFVGVTFVARPRFIFFSVDNSVQNKDSDMLGTALAFGSAIAISFTLNIMGKQLDFEIHSCFPLLAHGIMTFGTSSIVVLLLYRWHFQSLLEWSLSIAAGSCFVLAQVMVYLALETESITLVNVVLTTDIIMVFVLQFLPLRVHPPWTSYVGATFIMSACIGTTLNKRSSSELNEL